MATGSASHRHTGTCPSPPYLYPLPALCLLPAFLPGCKDTVTFQEHPILRTLPIYHWPPRKLEYVSSGLHSSLGLTGDQANWGQLAFWLFSHLLGAYYPGAIPDLGTYLGFQSRLHPLSPIPTDGRPRVWFTEAGGVCLPRSLLGRLLSSSWDEGQFSPPHTTQGCNFANQELKAGILNALWSPEVGGP